MRSMPTIFSHTAPVLALSAGLYSPALSTRLVLAGLFFSILPDFDVVGFKLGISYASVLGHRGLSHSLLFALGSGIIGILLARFLHTSKMAAFIMLGGAVLTHIVLDAMTTGGLGVAFFWPWAETRYFLPWRPIAVSPFCPKALLSTRGLVILYSELLWVWLPAVSLAILLYLSKRVALPPCHKK